MASQIGGGGHTLAARSLQLQDTEEPSVPTGHIDAFLPRGDHCTRLFVRPLVQKGGLEHFDWLRRKDVRGGGGPWAPAL